jgi:hypothetical protein
MGQSHLDWRQALSALPSGGPPISYYPSGFEGMDWTKLVHVVESIPTLISHCFSSK